jgi:hypothetical protein
LGSLRVRFAGPERLHAPAVEPPFDPGGARPAIRLGPDLARGVLARLAAGRRVHVGTFASRCCAELAIGDLAAHWVDVTVPADSLETLSIGVVERVPVSADRLLFPVLAAGRPMLVLGGPRAGHLAIRLGRPVVWAGFADGRAP